MKTLVTRTTTLAICVFALLASTTTFADGYCEREPETFKLKIKLKNNRPTEVTHKGQDAEEFHVCIGDSIEWQVSGFDRKEFYIAFEGAVPSRGGKERQSRNGKILVRIDDGEPGDAYKYLIGIVDGGEWDPVVIIDR